MDATSGQLRTPALAPRSRGAGPQDPAAAGARVVVGVDGSADSVAALLWAAPEARRRGAALHIVAAWEGDPAGGSGCPGSARVAARRLDRALRHVLREERCPERIECDSARGDPGQVLLDRASGAELLVLGLAAGGNGRMPGTTGRYCLRNAHLPVVFVAGPFRA